MMLVWGSANYGRCDTVPGLCHVTTRFGHLYYVPLIPTASYVVVGNGDDGSGFRGTAIPLCMKSVLLAWARAILVMAAIGAVVLVINGTSAEAQQGPTMLVGGGLLILSGVLLFASYRLQFLTLADRERARHLAILLGVDEDGLQTIEEMYDAMDTPTIDDDFVFDSGFMAEDPRFKDIEN